jgi:hypothetical protein
MSRAVVLVAVVLVAQQDAKTLIPRQSALEIHGVV